MTTRLPQLEVAATTDTGLVRALNEDAILAQQPWFLVADGVGGQAAGDLASQAAIAAFAQHVDPQATLDDFSARYAAAKAAVQDISAANEGGAGSTLAGASLVLRNDGFYWLVSNVGDSRVYQFAAGLLQQVTIDHTLRDELLAAGMSADDSRLPGRNVITRALGTDDDTSDTWLLPVVAGEQLLICSDGLSGCVSDETIAAVLAEQAPEQAVTTLLQAALTAGAPDNISVIVVKVLDAGEVAAVALPEPAPGAEEAEPESEIESTLDLTGPLTAAQESAESSAAPGEQVN